MLFKTFSFILLLVLIYSSDKNKEEVLQNLRKTLCESDNLSWTPTVGINPISDDECNETDYTNFLVSYMKKSSRGKSSAGEAATSRLLKKADQTWNFNFICEKYEVQKVKETKGDAYTSLLDSYSRVMYCKNNTDKDLQKAETLINKERFSKKELESIENIAYHRSLQNAPYSQYKISEKQTTRKNNLIDMFELAKQEEAKEESISKFAEKDKIELAEQKETKKESISKFAEAYKMALISCNIDPLIL